ncbi:hypothetical protein [Actinacidiphila glaucinigra]|uniref:hypothetical protein n=1 Tax=Actinacidiphila glaucinigra TaxID=235986 RepID=UPI0036EB1E6F
MKPERRRPAGAFGPIAASALATALLGGAAVNVQAAPAEGASRPVFRPGAVFGAGSGSGGSARTVTLVTGDKVTVDRAGKVTGVSAAEGREGMTFRISRAAGGHAFAVPRDAERLLADGTGAYRTTS